MITAYFGSPEVYRAYAEGARKHPVDALKDMGVVLSPEREAAMRALCDEQVYFCPRCGQIIHAGCCVNHVIISDGISTKDGCA